MPGGRIVALLGADRRTRRRRGILVVLVWGLLVVNGGAWMQAWAMTHYAAGGPATPSPGALAGLAKVWTLAGGVNVPRPRNTYTPADAGLPYTVQRIALPDGETLEAWSVPRGAARGLVLLFPGYAASKESLLAPAAAFRDLGYATLLVDFRGAGGSSGDDTTLGVREGADVAAALTYARQTWPDLPLVLYGFSMGSAAVLRAVAHDGARPAAVILESPFDRLLHTVSNRFKVMGLPPFPGAELLVLWGSVQHGFDGFADNPAEDAAAVTCPALVLYGQGDPMAPPGEAEAVYSGLGGPRQIAGLPSPGHGLLLLGAPDAWQARVHAFLDSVPVASR